MGKQIRSHSVVDTTTFSSERLDKIKTSCDDESDQRIALTKMLDNIKELIKQKELKETKAIIGRRLSAIDDLVITGQGDDNGFQEAQLTGKEDCGITLVDGTKGERIGTSPGIGRYCSGVM